MLPYAGSYVRLVNLESGKLESILKVLLSYANVC
jgi:hypothetical protein